MPGYEGLQGEEEHFQAGQPHLRAEPKGAVEPAPRGAAEPSHVAVRRGQPPRREGGLKLQLGRELLCARAWGVSDGRTVQAGSQTHLCRGTERVG